MQFRLCNENTQLDELDTVTLDTMACDLLKELNNLETFGKDWNGNWISKADKRNHAKWTQLYDCISDILDKRPEAN